MRRREEEPMDVPTVTPFSLRTEEKQGTTVVYLEGELDLAGVPKLREALHSAQHEKVSQIIVDLQGLTFLDSSGLGALIAADTAGRDGHVAVSFVRGNRTVHRVFQLTAMESRLNWVDPLD
jgi:anti-sigma B factor antagonist